MVWTHKFLWTNRTFEALFSSMSSYVSLKFIRSSKAFSTKRPQTNKWPVTHVPSYMCLKILFKEGLQVMSRLIPLNVMSFHKVSYNEWMDKCGVVFRLVLPSGYHFAHFDNFGIDIDRTFEYQRFESFRQWKNPRSKACLGPIDSRVDLFQWLFQFV